MTRAELNQILARNPQLRVEENPGVSHAPEIHVLSVSNKLERDDQRLFANWCLLHNYPFYWHSTAHRTKATPGVPDFVVGINRTTLWIEFKRDGCGLSEDQQKFRERLEAQGIPYHLVYSHQEAIALTK